MPSSLAPAAAAAATPPRPCGWRWCCSAAAAPPGGPLPLGAAGVPAPAPPPKKPVMRRCDLSVGCSTDLPLLPDIAAGCSLLEIARRLAGARTCLLLVAPCFRLACRVLARCGFSPAHTARLSRERLPLRAYSSKEARRTAARPADRPQPWRRRARRPLRRGAGCVRSACLPPSCVKGQLRLSSPRRRAGGSLRLRDRWLGPVAPNLWRGGDGAAELEIRRGGPRGRGPPFPPTSRGTRSPPARAGREAARAAGHAAAGRHGGPGGCSAAPVGLRAFMGRSSSGCRFLPPPAARRAPPARGRCALR